MKYIKPFSTLTLLFLINFTPNVSHGMEGKPGEIHGTVTFNSDPVLNVVVYLSGEDAEKFSTGVSEYTVVQKNLTFEPKLVVVPMGSDVSFENKDNEIHNIFSRAKRNRFDTGAHMPGTVAVVTFALPEAVPIRCNTHFNMRGMIYVAPSPYFAITDMMGKFKILNVPPGDYKVETWHPRLTPQEAEKGAVEIKLPGKPEQINLKFSPESDDGTDLTEVFSQDWDLVIQDIQKELEAVMAGWKKGSRRGATTKVMTIQSRLYESSGLKNTIQQTYGRERVITHEKFFDRIRKGVQGVTKKPITETALKKEMDTLISTLQEDVEKIQQKE
ncbi:MAG TPA: hypothetical protein VGB26_11940 [Nitrospiria bacterium]|jgi:plastocyanin